MNPIRQLNLDAELAPPVQPLNSPVINSLVSEVNSFKQDKKNELIKEKVLAYFAEYPTFKNGLLTNAHIQKMCCVIEKFAYQKGADKKRIVLQCMERIAGRPLTTSEKELTSSTIEFLHQSGLIKVSLLLKIYHRLIGFFR